MRKLFILFLLFPFILHAQPIKSNIQDTIVNAKLLTFNFSPQFPSGDLAKRFGFSYTFGASFLFKTGKNWLFGVEGNYLFGGRVKDDSAIYALANASGNFTGDDGINGSLDLSERGYMI